MIGKGLFTVSLGALALAGCAVPQSRVAVAPIADKTLGLGSQAAPAIAADWWTALGDPQLDRIIGDALADSPTLESAMARVRAAESSLGGAEAARRPQVSADASEQFQRLSNVYIYPPPYGGTFRWVGQAQVNLSWDLDFWHRQADAVRQAGAGVDAAHLDYDAARLALSGSIAQTYVEMVRAERQIAIARSTVDQRDQSLRLAKLRVKSQLDSNIDVRAAETLLAEANQALVRAQGQRELVIHALALLAGKGADYYATIQPTSLKLDAVLPLPDTIPADLLARRPDILSAKARIAAAAAGRQVARKAFYPDVNLLGLVGLQALGIGNLFSSSASTYGPGAAIHLPIFEGGKLKADYEGATAKLDGAIADYNQTVLGAVRETADALTRVQTTSADLAQQQQAAAGLADVRRLDDVRVSAGLSSRLDLIGSDVRLLEAQQETANLQADKAVANIQLLVALGGGFDPAVRPATPDAKDSAMTDTINDIRPEETIIEEAAPQIETAPPAERGKPRARRTWFAVLAGVVILAVLIYAIYRLFFAVPNESTDDAYVGGDTVTITARDPGTVIALYADDTERVRAGQPLVDLDPATADVDLQAAAAQLGQAVRGVRANFSAVNAAQAEVTQADADLARARNDLSRRQQAAAQGAVSGEEVSHAADTVKTAGAALNLAQSKLAQAETQVEGADVHTNPDVLAAIASYRRAAIKRSHMHIVAPIDGTIAQRTVQIGQQINAGTPLMAVVPLHRVWVDANFRETQLADLRVGQPATITTDTYGGKVTYHGHVIGLGAGSGNAFALLPPQNASGNWIKIVQRVPVRIALNPDELDKHPLRVGLSVDVDVDTANTAGSLLGREAQGTYLNSPGDSPNVDADIARIIAANAGRGR